MAKDPKLDRLHAAPLFAGCDKKELSRLLQTRPQMLENKVHPVSARIPYPRANERVGSPPRRTGDLFVSAPINGRDCFLNNTCMNIVSI